jgi:hypothetical protein
MQKLLFAVVLAATSLVTVVTPAQTVLRPIPVTISIVGEGEIMLLVADGNIRPCDSSDNHLLFKEHVKAGDEIKLASLTGAVCVDHTYGAFRESQWAGASVWGGHGARFGTSSSQLQGAVSTDVP